MKCQSCDNEMFLDSVVTKGNKEFPIYICVNPNCREYKVAINSEGDKETRTIKTKQEKDAQEDKGEAI